MRLLSTLTLLACGLSATCKLTLSLSLSCQLVRR